MLLRWEKMLETYAELMWKLLNSQGSVLGSSHIFVFSVTRSIMTPRRLARQLMKATVISVLITMFLFALLYSTALTVFDSSNAEAETEGGFNQARFHSGRRRTFKSRFHSDRNDADSPHHRKPHTLWDYNSLMSSITVEPKCYNASVIVLVTSAPEHIHQRQAIRETWCSSEQCMANQYAKCQCVFLIGNTANSVVKANVISEIQEFRDILLGDYMDTYRNLSMKVLTGFHWVSHSCKTDYILKTDDDCFVNTYVLLKFISAQKRKFQELYVGNIFTTEKETVVIRERGSKWGIDREDYAPDHYPPYASGTGYIISSDIVAHIIDTSRLYKPFPNEDAYIGILINYIGVAPVHSHRFTLVSQNWTTCNFLYFLVIHHVSTDEQWEMLNQSLAAVQECADQLLITTWS